MSEESVKGEPTPEVIAQRKHPAAKCEECPFSNDKNYVPTYNLIPSGKIAIVGAAPGVHEARKGIPFTGPSGELTDQILQHHGIRRDEVMLTNTVSCKPEGQDSDPPKAAIDACRPRLVQEIAESGVETIVSLGKVAMGETINDRGSMRKIRVGPPKPYKYDANVGVIATWHTAYALRSPDSFPDIVFDFGKIRGKVEHDWVEPDYRVFDNPVSAARALQELRARFDRVVIDIETGVEKDNSFDHPSEYDLLCVGIAFAKGKAVVIGEVALQDDGVRAELRNLLSTAKIIAHNGKFDLAGLRNVCGRQTLWFDTMLASNTLDERPGRHGLKQLSIERLGAPEYEADIRDYVPRGGNYANIPRDVLYKYNAYDVVCTWDLYELFSNEFTETDWQKHDFIVQAANALIELELNGIHFDVEYNEKLSHQYQTILADIEAKMDELVGYVVNPRSPKQLTDYYATHHLQLPSTNADLLKELRDKLDGEVLQFTDLLLEHRRKAKLYGCVDEETEILTQRGWLRFDEVRPGDVTLSINEHSGFAEWDEIEGVHLYPGQHELVSWEGRDFSALTTHDHRWLVDNNGSFGSRPGLKWKTTDTVAHGDRIPKAALCSTLPTQPKYSDAFVELVGWIWTEGSKDMTGLNIVQSHTKNLSNVERIRRALVEICPNPIKGTAYNAHNPYWSERKANDSITEFYLNAALSEEFFDVFVTHKVVEPAFITSLTYSQLKLFVEVSMLGDGHVTSKGQGNSHLAQSRKEQLFAFQLACTLLGIPTSELRKDKDYYGIYMHKGKYHHPRLVEWRNGGRKLVNYDGTVWCVTTTNQNWLARRNGKVYYTGNTYVKGLAKRVTAEGKVYTTYTLHGTTSGRLASRQPNLQNIVREKSIRNQFVVSHPDNRFIQLDYKQAEGRVITTLARDEYLREIFTDPDRDLFSELCDQIFGVGVWAKENRVAMKAIFYGNAYGRGAASIAKELQLQTPPVNITVPEAAQLMREFNALIPDVMAWQSAVKKQVLAGNDLTTPFGRKRSFWLITDKNRSDVLNEALSYMPQSIASDICLRALIRLTPMLRGLAIPRLTIHDAIVVETHKDKVDEVIELMRHEMVKSATEFTTYVPFEVDASIGTVWGEL